MSGEGAALLQSATGHGQVDAGPARRPRQAIFDVPEVRNIAAWLHVGLRDEASNEFEALDTIQPGHTYRVRVRLVGEEHRPAEGFLGTWSTSLGNVKLELEQVDGADAVIRIDPNLVEDPENRLVSEAGMPYVYIRERQLAGNFGFDFLLEVPAAADIAILRLRLYADHQRASHGTRVPLSEVAVSLKPGVRAPAPRTFDAFHLDTSSAGLESVAFVTLREESGQLHISADSSLLPMRGEARIAKDARLKLGSLLTQGMKPVEFVADSIFYSRQPGMEPFLSWIRELLAMIEQRAGENDGAATLCLVINDFTDSELPWELLRLGDRGFLGEFVEIVRWATITDAWARPRPFVVKDAACRGTVVGFLDHGQRTGNEKQCLQALGWSEECELKEALKTLARQGKEIGLFYLACHGHFAIGRVPDDEVQMSLSALEREQGGEAKVLSASLRLLSAPKGQWPVVFVNACHSGRLLVDRANRRFGLPEIFLSQIAEGFVGTLGAVGQIEAEAIGAEILGRVSHAEAAGGLVFCKALRELRAAKACTVTLEDIDDASNGDADAATMRRIRELFNAFMYVYYGNPNLRVLVTAEVDE